MVLLVVQAAIKGASINPAELILDPINRLPF
jgi:hypothetical protein